MAYSDKVIDHYSNPRNVGSFTKDTPGVGTGLVGAPECGDVMKLQIKVNVETGVIEDAKFKTFGCGSAIASSSLATEWLKGKTVDDAAKIKNTDIVNELKLPPVKIHCSVLAEDAIKAALRTTRRSGSGRKRPRRKTHRKSERSRARRTTSMAVSLTEKATKQVKQLIQAQNLENVYLRMGVKGGGCSGMSYSLEFDNEIGPHDKKFEIDGVPVVCDAKSYLYLNGTTLDYVTEGLTGGFTFVNPNAKSSCGCGTSFSA